eukprot:TRINITY_DN7313_c0_g2_i1.p1 TRINITY_DN7313_c0_g2~~TRINITY_DN7313_c0_g2_i1.p1  ORF type:complete len:276 (+),score=45.93 TRINITY_DN7313_c0_g2_i1:279-1106(+)
MADDYELPQDCRPTGNSQVETAADSEYMMPQTTPNSLAAQMARLSANSSRSASNQQSDSYANLQGDVARRDYVNLQSVEDVKPPPRPPKSAAHQAPPPTMPSRQDKPAAAVEPARRSSRHSSMRASMDRSAPRPPPLKPVPVPPEQWGGLALQQQSWYVGSMDKDTAVKHLQYAGRGSYLVRASTNPSRIATGSPLVVSCWYCVSGSKSNSTPSDADHLPIATMMTTDPRTNKQVPHYCLPSIDDTRLFKSVIALIEAYQGPGPVLYLQHSAIRA